MWALWDTGALNGAVLPATCLTLASRYRPPELIRAVARGGTGPGPGEPGRYEPWWGRQVYRGQYQFEHDLVSRPYGSDVRIWKTGHAMLSSVQDYRPALPGLPTHVWFPAPFMDETVQHGSWLAGRVGLGYVAIACAGGLRPVRAGGTARQGWMPAGSGRAFAATVGCAEQDGSFAEFLEGLAEPDFSLGDGVAWTARDGRRLALPGTGGFTVGGPSPDIGPGGRPGTAVHLEDPACTARFGEETLTAEYAGHRMVLDIARARRATGAPDA
jgi:hypothetical protein